MDWACLVFGNNSASCIDLELEKNTINLSKVWKWFDIQKSKNIDMPWYLFL